MRENHWGLVFEVVINYCQMWCPKAQIVNHLWAIYQLTLFFNPTGRKKLLKKLSIYGGKIKWDIKLFITSSIACFDFHWIFYANMSCFGFHFLIFHCECLNLETTRKSLTKPKSYFQLLSQRLFVDFCKKTFSHYQEYTLFVRFALAIYVSPFAATHAH